ncbi:MAG: hypothetical protein ACLR02_12320 [Clostridium sp.]
MFISNLKQIEEIVNKTHPMNIVNKVGELNICLFKVTIEYTTARKNKKQRKLLFLLNTVNIEDDLKNEVSLWQENYNSNKSKNRRISNAIILDKSCVGLIRI